MAFPAAADFCSTEPRPSPPSPLAAALAAADELACVDAGSMPRRAVELARTRLGLERVGLFLRDTAAEGILLRGSWGTGAHGETTDERSLCHVLPPTWYEALLASRQSGALGLYVPRTPLFAYEQGQPIALGEGWIMATPLFVAKELVGVMYNDTALTQSPIDEAKQAAANVFCTLLALHCGPRSTLLSGQAVAGHAFSGQAVAGQSFAGQYSAGGGQSAPGLGRYPTQAPLVERVLQALNEDLPVTGERLASELGVSPGHLARSFKRKMGVSLVDYRNQLRLERFLVAVQRRGNGSNLLDAALEAGFGSYAQFHRVYRKFRGATPREVFISVSPGASCGEPARP
jgi:AraC-like DNA-binding protein